MFAIASIAYMNVVEFAMAAVAVKSAFGDTARNAAVNRIRHNTTSSSFSIPRINEKYDASR